MPVIFSEIAHNGFARASALVVGCAFFIFVSPPWARHFSNFRYIHEIHDYLESRIIDTRFKGELLSVPGRTGQVYLIPLFWVCRTLLQVKDHIYDNATELFSVIILVQACFLIGSADRARNVSEWLRGTESFPVYEFIAIMMLNFAVWRVGSYWKKARDNFRGSSHYVERLRAEVENVSP